MFEYLQHTMRLALFAAMRSLPLIAEEVTADTRATFIVNVELFEKVICRELSRVGENSIL